MSRLASEQAEELGRRLTGALDRLAELRSEVARIREEADEAVGAGLVGLNIERALISLTAADRELGRAYQETER